MSAHVTVSRPPAFCRLPSSVCQNIWFRLGTLLRVQGLRSALMRRRSKPETQSAEGTPAALSPETTLSMCAALSRWLRGVAGSPRFPRPGSSRCFHRPRSQNTIVSITLLVQAHTVESEWLSSVPALFFSRLRHSCVFPKRLTNYQRGVLESRRDYYSRMSWWVEAGRMCAGKKRFCLYTEHRLYVHLSSGEELFQFGI